MSTSCARCPGKPTLLRSRRGERLKQSAPRDPLRLRIMLENEADIAHVPAGIV